MCRGLLNHLMSFVWSRFQPENENNTLETKCHHCDAGPDLDRVERVEIETAQLFRLEYLHAAFSAAAHPAAGRGRSGRRSEFWLSPTWAPLSRVSVVPACAACRVNNAATAQTEAARRGISIIFVSFVVGDFGLLIACVFKKIIKYMQSIVFTLYVQCKRQMAVVRKPLGKARP